MWDHLTRCDPICDSTGGRQLCPCEEFRQQALCAQKKLDTLQYICTTH